jgi:Lrp/AsnC family transcriptional regulator for asnA, asnC and gidA
VDVWLIQLSYKLKNINAVHQRMWADGARALRIKPIINEKKIGYDWGAFTGITLNKDEDSSRVMKIEKILK